MTYNAKNYKKQGGEEWVVGGKLVVPEGGEIDVSEGTLKGATDLAGVATGSSLGGVKAATTTDAGYNVAVKIKADQKLYVPAYPVLPTAATEEDAGIVKMAANVEEAEDAVGVDDFNGLLAALIAAGLMSAPGEP